MKTCNPMKKFYFFLSLSVILFFTSCSEPLAPTISISQRFFSVPYTGGEVEFTIASNMPWEITAEADDPIVFSPKSGKIGEHVIKATIPPTTSILNTPHNLKVTSIGEKTTAYSHVKITQDSKPGFILSKESAIVPLSGGVIEIIVTSNLSWSATSNVAELNIYPENNVPAGEYTVKITVPASNEARTIKVDFNIPNNQDLSKSLIIEQK